MSAPRIISPLCHLSDKNYQNWWKFEEVRTKTILHSFFETRCRSQKKTVRNYYVVVRSTLRCQSNGDDDDDDDDDDAVSAARRQDESAATTTN